jgi:REP element-mobilizing transposase RayT
MPDHIHALVEGNAPESDLLLFVRNFKRMSSREYFKATGQQLWQKKFYDHVLRTKDSPDAVSWHIWMNPVRKGLSDEPTEYPLSGSFTGAWRHMIQPEEIWVPAWKGEQVARP